MDQFAATCECTLDDRIIFFVEAQSTPPRVHADQDDSADTTAHHLVVLVSHQELPTARGHFLLHEENERLSKALNDVYRNLSGEDS